MNPRRLLLGVPFGVLLAVVLGLAAPAQAGRLDCDTLPKLVDSYLQAHIAHDRPTPDLRRRATESWVRSLDSSKTLFLEAEAEALLADGDRIFRRIRQGDCSPLMEVQERLHERYVALEALVKEILGDEDFEIDPTVELVIDPEERGYPDTDAQRRELIRRLIHFQLSNLLAGEEEDADDARERLVHRYELMRKRSSEVTEEDVLAAFLDAFARSLDPHSNYFSAEAMEDFQIGMSLSLEGIGVALSSRDGYPVVEQIIPGGATDRIDALQPNDKIIAVAQAGEEPVSVVDMALRDVVRLIRGKKGTTVRLTVLRQGESTKRFNVTIVRDTIDLKEQAAKIRYETRQVGDRTLKLAVLDLRSFYGDRDPTKRRSSDDVRQLLEEAREAGADGLLLDLSRNGGGNLEYAVEISGFFIEEGGIVAIRESGGRSRVLRDPDDDILWEKPVVVLTSRISASASEILAGALKDYDRAVIAGDSQTFGKGSVQTVIPLPPGLGALKVTTAMFFRPGGRSTQLGGVEPHVRIPSTFDREEFGEAEQDYALPNQEMSPFAPPPATRAAKRLGSWDRLDPAIVAELVVRSRDRVAESEPFDEIVANLAEAKEKEGVIRLAEILEEREADEQAEAQASGGAPHAGEGTAAGDAAIPTPLGPPSLDDEDDDELSLQAQEALSILADLVMLQG